MASISDNDDSSSSDNDDDTVFYDASSNLSSSEITTPLSQEPRWRISSKNEQLKKPEHFYTISLTDNQIQDIERRDKLQRLRGYDNRNSQSTIPKTPIQSPTVLSTLTVEQDSDSEDTATPDLKDSLDSAHIRHLTKSSAVSIPKQILTHSPSISSTYRQQHPHSLPYSTLPATSVRVTGQSFSYRKSLSASSDPNTVDINTIDHITRFGEVSPNSPKLNDDEILQQPIVLNLDNGKYFSLGDANPMTQTILERAHGNGSMIGIRHNSIIRKNSVVDKSLSKSETDISNPNHKNNINDENESTSSESSSHTTPISSSSVTSKSSTSARHKTSFKRQLTRFVIRRLLRKGKSKLTYDHHDSGDMEDEEDDGEKVLINDGSNGDLKYKASRYLKDQAQFDKTQLLQTIVNAHHGPIWCMRFSPDGHFLATGGQDSLLKVWVLKSAQPYFNDFSRLTSNQSKQQNEILSSRFNQFHDKLFSEPSTPTINTKLGLHELQAPLYSRPFCELIGHQAPVLDVAWSRSLFLLSSSMDKTVRLWHLSRLECLCFFRHVDFVSAIAFHPRDDRYFVSASLDGHVRLWNIPDKRVVYWTLIPAQASSQITAAQANLITAVNFCDDGRKVTVGTFDGRFLLYTDSLQYDTVINIGDKDGSRSHRSRKKRRKPYKITGIESMNSNNSKVLITSNDSRVRLYNIRTKEIERKYRGYSNQSSQIRGSFSHDDRYIISGSEDSWFYIWRTEPNNDGHLASANAKLTRKQRRYFDRAYERIRVHNTMVTSAIFAPNPVEIMNYLQSSTNCSPLTTRSFTPTSTPSLNNHRSRLTYLQAASNSSEGSLTMNYINNGSTYVMVTADSKGQLKLLVNRYHR